MVLSLRWERKIYIKNAGTQSLIHISETPKPFEIGFCCSITFLAAKLEMMLGYLYIYIL